MTGLWYFLLGAAAGGVPVWVTARHIGYRAGLAERPVPGPAASWLVDPAPVCVACRLGECALHDPRRSNGVTR